MLNSKNSGKLDQITSLHLKKHIIFLFWAHFLSKPNSFFQLQGAEINVEVSLIHVFGSNIENSLSSKKHLMKFEMKVIMNTLSL